jgi:hypothetical protein
MAISCLDQKISDCWLIFFGCNHEWLATGKGSMFATEAPPVQQARKRLVATVEQGYGTRVVEKQREAIDMPEMVKMTMEIMASDTVYRSALASNIRAFHNAVNMEIEMNEVRREIAEMAERMARMEEMLLSLGATVPEKRETRNG